MYYFVPHLVPPSEVFCRRVYLRVADGVTLEAVRAVYEKYYAREPFVHLDAGLHPDPRQRNEAITGVILGYFSRHLLGGFSRQSTTA